MKYTSTPCTVSGCFFEIDLWDFEDPICLNIWFVRTSSTVCKYVNTIFVLVDSYNQRFLLANVFKVLIVLRNLFTHLQLYECYNTHCLY